MQKNLINTGMTDTGNWQHLTITSTCRRIIVNV